MALSSTSGNSTMSLSGLHSKSRPDQHKHGGEERKSKTKMKKSATCPVVKVERIIEVPDIKLEDPSSPRSPPKLSPYEPLSHKSSHRLSKTSRHHDSTFPNSRKHHSRITKSVSCDIDFSDISSDDHNSSLLHSSDILPSVFETAKTTTEASYNSHSRSPSPIEPVSPIAPVSPEPMDSSIMSHNHSLADQTLEYGLPNMSSLMVSSSIISPVASPISSPVLSAESSPVTSPIVSPRSPHSINLSSPKMPYSSNKFEKAERYRQPLQGAEEMPPPPFKIEKNIPCKGKCVCYCGTIMYL